MQGKTRVAVIGCGRISVVYRDAFRKLADEVEVVLAIDKDPTRAEAFAAEFPGCAARSLPDPIPLDVLRGLISEMVEETRPDAAHILTPHFLHHDHAIAFLEAGVDVLTEKPISITLADADDMAETARRCDRRFGVVFQNRYIEGVREARRELFSGSLGAVKGAWSTLNWFRPPSYYACDWKGLWEREGGGVVIDQAIHSIDLVRWLMNAEVAKIQGRIDRRVLTQIEVEDVADAAITYENGAVHSFFACNYYVENSDIRIELGCEKGSILLEKDVVTIRRADGTTRVIRPDGGAEAGEGYWGAHHRMQLEAFYRCRRAGEPVPFDPMDAKRTLAVVLGIYQSSREGRAVMFRNGLPMEAPVEVPVDASVEAPVEVPVDASVDTPVEAPVDAEGHLLIVHGGGPTAVLNASLYGAINEARRKPQVARILGASGGTGGYLRGDLVDLTDVPAETLNRLLTTPGSAIGTSRDHMTEDDYERFVDRLEKDGIRFVLFNGGNGTMETCGRVYERCERRGNGIRVMGIPKTMDNDIAVTDHCPGFGSAARYLATSVAEVCADVRSLPIHVAVVEASGRNAGWLTAASALAAECGGDGPDLILVPERPFDEEAFLQDIRELIERKGYGVVVASEGLHDAVGNPIVEPIFQVGRATYFGDVGTHLANLIIRRLGYKARGEKPGLLGRASIALQSPVDRDEAILAGVEAARAVVSGASGAMVAFRRTTGSTYGIEPFLVPISEVMLSERTLPAAYLNEHGNGVTQAFLDWCRPLVGELPTGHLHFR